MRKEGIENSTHTGYTECKTGRGKQLATLVNVWKKCTKELGVKVKIDIEKQKIGSWVEIC